MPPTDGSDDARGQHERARGRAERARADADRARAEAERARAEAEHARSEAETEAEWSGFLAEPSRVLTASLDYETTLRTVANLAVPRLTDWCGIDILGDDQQIHRLALAHVDPSKEALTKGVVRRYPRTPPAPLRVTCRILSRRMRMPRESVFASKRPIPPLPLERMRRSSDRRC